MPKSVASQFTLKYCQPIYPLILPANLPLNIASPFAQVFPYFAASPFIQKGPLYFVQATFTICYRPLTTLGVTYMISSTLHQFVFLFVCCL